jgi:hypothetical protein
MIGKRAMRVLLSGYSRATATWVRSRAENESPAVRRALEAIADQLETDAATVLSCPLDVQKSGSPQPHSTRMH